MIFFSDDNSEMGFFNNQDLNSDIISENNNLYRRSIYERKLG